MQDRLERAHDAVHRAADVTDDATVHKQLQSIEEGLEEMTQQKKTEGDVPHGDDLQEVEAKLAGLGDEVEGRARSLIQEARDHIDDYRQDVTRDW